MFEYDWFPTTKRLLVLYGSQTGTAQEAAERIWRKSKAYGYSGPVLSMDDFNIRNLVYEHFVVFVCSTTGQGDTPDNMSKSWTFLKQKNLPASSLYKLRFSVLGLGDSSYTKYNHVGKKLFKRLVQLGAKPLIDIGLCDYQHDLGHEAVMGPWIEDYFYCIPDLGSEIDTDFIPRWKVSLQDVDHSETPTQDKIAHPIYWYDGCGDFHLTVVSNVRTTHETHSQDVRLIQLKIKDDAHMAYLPGYVFNVTPMNSEEDVDDLFNIFESHNLNIKPNQILLVEELHKRMIILLLF